MTLRCVPALALYAAMLLAPLPADALQIFFAEDVGACPGPLPPACSLAGSAHLAGGGDLESAVLKEQAFLLALGAAAHTETLSGFSSGDGGSLDLFDGPGGAFAATLADPSAEQYGYIATGPHPERGFPVSEGGFWKNRTRPGGGLFTVEFADDVRAFGFYATGYATLAEPGGTQLVLRLESAGGGLPLDLKIQHSLVEQPGNVFYFGVIADAPFRRATLWNQGFENHDVIGFDDFTAAAHAPEPSAAALLGTGLLGLAAARRSRARPIGG
jgi:hypothetical protein